MCVILSLQIFWALRKQVTVPMPIVYQYSMAKVDADQSLPLWTLTLTPSYALKQKQIQTTFCSFLLFEKAKKRKCDTDLWLTPSRLLNVRDHSCNSKIRKRFGKSCQPLSTTITSWAEALYLIAIKVINIFNIKNTNIKSTVIYSCDIWS
mgnify:FL=1